MHILHTYYLIYPLTDRDGGQSVEFYWIDPMLCAERTASKSKYAGHMYYQYEPEWSWERPGIRAFGRVNGGLVFESCYIVDKHSVPLLSVFYADKAHNRGWSHHPIYRKSINIFPFHYILRILCIFNDACFVQTPC